MRLLVRVRPSVRMTLMDISLLWFLLSLIDAQIGR